MMRALFSGVTGLRTHQTRMDVIGNNISNVNTLGFKKSVANFADLYSETVAPASAPTANQGGVNARQIGLGVTCNAIVIKHSPGAAQYTGNVLDLAISGDGFFTVRTGEGERYTRAGNLSVSSNGSLVTPSGYFVQGFNALYRAGDAGKISGSTGISNAAATGFNSYTFTANNNAVTTAGSGTYTFEINANNKVNMYKNGILIQEDLDITTADGATTVTNANGFQPNTNYKVSTNLGDITFATSAHAMNNLKGLTDASGTGFENVTFTVDDTAVPTAEKGGYSFKVGADNASLELMKDGTAVAGGPFSIIDDATGAAVTAFTAGNTYTVTTPLGKVTFTATADIDTTSLADSAAQLNAILGNGSFSITGPVTEGANGFGTAISNLDTLMQNATITISNNDAFSAGNTIGDIVIDQDAYENITINEEGAVIGQLKAQGTPPGITGAVEMAKGEKVILGYLALANFTNTEGLEKMATNLYAATANSGRVTYNLAGSGGTGGITPSSLEMSNVDLSEEMVNMITTQRGFQANSRIITTTDSMLEELINLKR
ncbi:flagellar hook protein FlgE [Christensenella intestinihominis]|uniref:flagellar hook protein FlgE n=1 Tax=Christensenella intestinihominis TaxID=1851429 RepID=UPI0008337EEB|nr:flagellar hook-basal body complex protein [Christensenella intestinihominis]